METPDKKELTLAELEALEDARVPVETRVDELERRVGALESRVGVANKRGVLARIFNREGK